MTNPIQVEFAHQAPNMAVAPAFNADSALGRLIQVVCSRGAENVLDLACGPGIVAAAIAPYVQEVVGMDVTPEMIGLARRRFGELHLTNGRFVVGSAESLPFEMQRFDRVVSRLSFHHFADLPAVLAEIQRLLRPHGRLIIADILTVDNPDDAALHNSLEQLRDPTHVQMRTQAELLNVVRSAGFDICSEETWNQERTVKEWAQIVDDPARTEPLQQVMRALVRAGHQAGICLREDSSGLLFTHSWLLITATVN